MRDPGLSVCVPNYNHARYIGEAIGTMLTQNVPPTEIIVVDDASTDDSLDVIGRFTERHKNIRLLRNLSNQGPFQSINRGLAEATGEYVYVAAADDKVLPGFFEKCLHSLEENREAGLCSSYPKLMNADGNFLDRRHIPPFHTHGADVDIGTPLFLSTGEVLKRVSKQPWFIGGAAAVIFRRAALADAGGLIEDLGLLADWFAVHYIALKYGMCYVPEPLVAFRIMPNSMGAKIVREPRVLLEQHARVFRLMNEGEYREVFPRSFVEAKRREFTYASVRGCLVNWQSNFVEELGSLVPPEKLVGRIGIRLLRCLMRCQQLMLKAYCYCNVAPVLREGREQRDRGTKSLNESVADFRMPPWR